LRGEGYTGSYDAVRRYARAQQREQGTDRPAAFVPLRFAQGEAYQLSPRLSRYTSRLLSMLGVSMDTEDVIAARIFRRNAIIVEGAVSRRVPSDPQETEFPGGIILRGGSHSRSRHLATIRGSGIMAKRTLPPAGLIALAAALCLIQPIRAGAQNAANAASGSASSAAAGSSSTKQFPDETPFLAENGAAMDKMMAGMSVKPTGDVDADFAAMMIPHHQGAIDMAMAELRYGKNEQLRRISQEIIVDQQQEIVAMRLALGQKLPASAPAPTQVPTSDSSAVLAPGHSFMPPESVSVSPSMKME